MHVFPGTAAAPGGLPPTAGRLVRDGAGLCFVPRFAFLDGTTYTVTAEGTTAAVLVRARHSRLAVAEVTGTCPTAAEVPSNWPATKMPTTRCDLASHSGWSSAEGFVMHKDFPSGPPRSGGTRPVAKSAATSIPAAGR
ncbi:MAG: hypothetical protein JWM19_2254 [Actinomycetia bacterium]|nr:hypothetical protein [Actinomycetes bacterium]